MMTPSCRLGHKRLWPAVLLYIRSDEEERNRLGKSTKSAMERSGRGLGEAQRARWRGVEETWEKHKERDGEGRKRFGRSTKSAMKRSGRGLERAQRARWREAEEAWEKHKERDGEEWKRLGKSTKSVMERSEKEFSEHFREIRNALRETFHRKSLNFVRQRKTKCNPKTYYKQ